MTDDDPGLADWPVPLRAAVRRYGAEAVWAAGLGVLGFSPQLLSDRRGRAWPVLAALESLKQGVGHVSG